MQGCRSKDLGLFQNDGNKVKIGIEVVISAMKKHEGHAGVQNYGCWLLYNLAKVKVVAKFLLGKSAAQNLEFNGVINHLGCMALAQNAYDNYKS